jgi:HPr kinase/phosphorylase
MKFIIENTAKEEGRIEKVSVKELIKQCNLKLLSGSEDQLITFSTVSVSRPGLFLTGFDEYFAATRAQVMGNAEMYFMFGLEPEKRRETYDNLFKRNIPCLILGRGLKPTQDMLESAEKYGVPVFLSSKITSEVVNSMMVYLNRLLAPSVTMHGVLVNVSGIGVLLLGESAIGKSETALELVHRGGRLISDDAVIVKRIEDDLVGYPPEVTRGFMEIRGVGIVDVERIYGVGAVQRAKEINLIIELERWIDNKEYERVGRDIQYCEILGINVPKIVIPVTAGRNLAIVIETAVGQYRVRQSGYVPADEVDKRMKEEK